MPHIDFQKTADVLPAAWVSRIIGQRGATRIKVPRMDQAYQEEKHGFNEARIVIDGRLELDVAGEAFSLAAGDMYRVQAGVPHAVRRGSHGSLPILDIAA
ncbi:MAG: hypothetical protein GAK35_03720 [Herbaspirillum frisingense]|uniref:Cupin type-2 domain-containing protein n=1 Tax=Herbaspirillum frisingense TaxID=92645 RepID=A0A7V8JSY7_9BURK|nr:MAG: hypothetical protein GAK35_03720 [Herbaspirillum frisingense]